MYCVTTSSSVQKHRLRRVNGANLTCSSEVTVFTSSSTNLSAEWCSSRHRRGVGMPSMVMIKVWCRQVGTVIWALLLCFDSFFLPCWRCGRRTTSYGVSKGTNFFSSVSSTDVWIRAEWNVYRQFLLRFCISLAFLYGMIFTRSNHCQQRRNSLQ